MVEFGTGYSMPMDREYGHNTPPHDNQTNDVGVSIGDFGMSLGLGPVPNVHAVKGKLYAGTKKLEFVFTGAGKGSGQGQTPEMYGKKQRQALEEIGKANRVDFTTHATVGVYGLAGMNQQGSFEKTQKNFSLQEIKRAIEFAADVGRGGPVVVHTGEYQRPIVDAPWNEQDDKWRKKFSMYEDEEGRTAYRVVDARSGSLVQEARKNKKISRPVWNRYEEGGDEWKEHNGSEYTDAKGHRVKSGDYLDPFGNRLDPEDRVPKFDKENQKFMTTQLEWKDLIIEAKEMTARAREVWRDWKSGKISEQEFKDSYWTKFENVKSEKDIDVRPEEAYIIDTLETQAANAKGWAHYYGGSFEDDVQTFKKLQKAYEFYKKLESTVDPEEKWKIQKTMRGILPELIPPEAEDPSEIIKHAMRETKRKMEQSQEASSSQWAQAAELKEQIRHIESAETYAFKEACDSYAQAALNAMMHSKKLMDEGKLKKPLTIAMENLFPESYGAHPDELIRLVHGSRERMIDILKQKGVAEEEAQKKSMDHITATFDTGHLNMWRKYWKGDENKSMAQNDQEYNQWMLEKLGKMIDAKILGHVHIDDNYGYHDDHLAPGEGNAPIRDMIKLLKEKGYKGELIVEPGADYTTDVSGFHSVMKTWRLFGSPVYGAAGGVAGGGKRRSWEQVGYGFFGQNQPPYFVFGAYSPSEDWTLWSGVPLE